MTPHRAPNFRDIHPTRRFYQSAREKFEKTLVQAHQPLQVNRANLLTLKPLPRERFPQGAAFDRRSMKIVPEADGAISRLLLTVPKFLDENDKPLKFRYARYEQHFSRLVSTFRHGTDWIIVCGEQERPSVQRWLSDAEVSADRVALVDSRRFGYSIWAQDPFVVLQGRSHLALCEGILFNREEDMVVADDVHAQVEGVVATQSYLYFQGGNVLGGRERTLVGADYIWKNTDRFGIESERAVRTYFEALLGTDVLCLGGVNSGDYSWHNDGILTGFGFQPLFHIDMYVTPTGVRNDVGREIVFFSRPRAAHRAVARWSEVPYLDNEQIDVFFDETQRQLEKIYEVRELPLLSTRGDLGGREEFVRNYFLTWGNALVEAGESPRVVIPGFVEFAEQFGLDVDVRRELQRVVETEWRRLGFVVDVIDGVEDLAWGDGSLHCVAKVLRRRRHSRATAAEECQGRSS